MHTDGISSLSTKQSGSLPSFRMLDCCVGNFESFRIVKTSSTSIREVSVVCVASFQSIPTVQRGFPSISDGSFDHVSLHYF